MPAGTTVRQVSAGSDHTCALASDNKAYCWGAGGSGRLGNGTTTNSSTPVAISSLLAYPTVDYRKILF